MADTTTKTQATLKAIADYFRLPGQTLKAFTEEWKSLSEPDKEDLKNGLGNGTMTY